MTELERVDGVSSATPTGNVSTNGDAATIDVILEGDPYTKAALGVVPRHPRPPSRTSGPE